VSDQGFIGETEARLRVALGGIQPWNVRGWRRSDPVTRRLSLEVIDFS
jgi:hypothetical protein